MTALHLGSLHPWEQALTLVLAFGPFALLGVVIWLRRRDDAAEQGRDNQEATGATTQVEPVETKAERRGLRRSR